MLITFHESIPVVSHEVIAEFTGNQQRTISLIINKHKSDFEEFGTLIFKISRVINEGKGNQPKTYLLNEQQATLLMTYLKNSPIVREFKKALVKEFYALRDQSHGNNLWNDFNYIQAKSLRHELKMLRGSPTELQEFVLSVVDTARKEAREAKQKQNTAEHRLDIVREHIEGAYHALTMEFLKG